MLPRALLMTTDLELWGGGEAVMATMARRLQPYATLDLACVRPRGRSPRAALAGIDRVIELGFPDGLSLAEAPAVWRAQRQLARELSERAPRLILAFSYPAAVRAALASWTGARTRVVWVSQEDVATLFRRGSWRRPVAFELVRRAGAEVVCLNEETYAAFQGMSFDPERLHRVRLSVDIRRFAPAAPEVRSAARKRLGFRPGAMVVVCVAHFSRLKRHELLVEALAAARAAGADVELALVGGALREAPERVPRLRARVAELGLTEHVYWAGEVEAVEEWLHASDAAVLASVSEVGPLALLEAGSVGLPLLGSDSAGIREVVLDGVTGLLFASGDAAACGAAMVRLARDFDLRARLGAGAADHVRRRHDISVMFERLDGLFARWMAGP